MALDLTTALGRYGFVGDLANSIPELKGIFTKAASEEWDPLRFQQAVMDSSWYRANAESARSVITQAITDPGTYKQTIKNASDKVYLIEVQMGLIPSSAARRDQIAKHFLYNNYDDEQIRRWLGINIGVRVGTHGALGGQAADYDAKMRELAQNYGVAYTDSSLRTELTKVLSGDSSLEGWESLMRQRAKASHPHLAAELDSGLTLRDIADPFISTMANTLEVPETNIDLTDLYVKRALSATNPTNGARTVMPLWEFERQLKNDPRWDKTKQARTQAFDTIAQVGRDFGFEAA